MKVINTIQDVGLPASRKRTREDHRDDHLVVTMTINQCVVNHILVDTGSSINVIFKDTFAKMAISWDRVIPYAALLVGFTSQIFKSKGQINLPVSVSDNTYMAEFLIVSTPFPYNCIMGRPALNHLHAKVSTCDLSMEIPIGEEIQMIYGE